MQLRGPGAISFSDKTARRRLRHGGLRAQIPVKRLQLEQRHQIARFN